MEQYEKQILLDIYSTHCHILLQKKFKYGMGSKKVVPWIVQLKKLDFFSECHTTGPYLQYPKLWKS